MCVCVCVGGGGGGHCRHFLATKELFKGAQYSGCYGAGNLRLTNQFHNKHLALKYTCVSEFI